jgi:adenylylsulfate kinase
LGKEVTKRLKEKDNGVVFLDGDELRKVIGAERVGNQNYDRGGRLELSMQYARLCKVISDQGLTVVISTISMFNEVYMWNRVNLERYFEVYLKVPMGVLQHRDPKNIYSRFSKGELTNIAGLDLPIDEPSAADWRPKYEPEKTVESLTHELLEILER